MPDSVRIGITSDYTGTGVSQAIGDLQKLEGAEKGIATSTGNVTNSMLGMAQAGGGLNTTLRGMLGTVASVVGGFISAGSAVMTFKQIYEFSEAGAQNLRLQNSFAKVAQSYDTNSQAIISSMRSASRGTIADTELMLSANRAMMLGVSTDAEELAKITAVAIERGRAMGLSSAEAIDRVYTGIGRLSPKILDDLGIITNATERYREYAEAHNISAEAIDDYTKREIIKNAVIAESAALLDESGKIAVDAATSYERFDAAWANYKVSEQVKTAGMFEPVNNYVANLLNSLSAQNRALADSGAGLFTTLNDVPGAMSDYYRKQAVNAMQYTQSQLYKTGYFASEKGLAAAPGQLSISAYVEDYKNLLAVGTDITKMTEEYRDKTVQLNDKLTEQREVLAELEAQHKTDGEQYLDQLKKIVDTEAAIDDLNKSAAEAYDKMALGAIKSRDATEEQQLQFAYASGMITEEAYQQSLAIDKISEAFVNNKLSAGAAAAGVNGVMTALQMYDGLSVAAYIDVYIRQHGGGINIPPPKDVGGGGTAGSLLFTGQGQAAAWLAANKWTGGPLGEGFTIVGDAPGGQWTPYTEVILGNRVFNAWEARVLRDAGVLDDARHAWITAGEGGSTYSNPYGGGSAGGRSTGTSGGSTGGGGSAGGRYNPQKPRTSSGGTSTTTTTGGGSTADIAIIAQEVAQQAVNTAQAAVAAQDATQANLKNNTLQQIEAQAHGTDRVVDAVNELIRISKKQPTTDDMYTVFKTSQQQSI